MIAGTYILAATPMQLWKSLRPISILKVSEKQRGLFVKMTSTAVPLQDLKQVRSLIKLMRPYMSHISVNSFFTSILQFMSPMNIHNLSSATKVSQREESEKWAVMLTNRSIKKINFILATRVNSRCLQTWIHSCHNLSFWIQIKRVIVNLMWTRKTRNGSTIWVMSMKPSNMDRQTYVVMNFDRWLDIMVTAVEN